MAWQRASLFLILLGQKRFCIWSPDAKKSIFIPTIFLFLFFHPQEHTNPTTLMDAKQQTLTLLLFLLFKLFIFDGLRAIQYIHHHCNSHRHHAIFLFALASQTNQGKTTKKKEISSLLFHTRLMFQNNQGRLLALTMCQL